MPVVASFRGDFETFYRAVEKAQVSLHSFEDGAAKVNQRLTTLGNSFSGVKIVQEAHLATQAMLDVGGMATLTDKNLIRLSKTVAEASEQMQRMGQKVPPGFKAITDEAAKAEAGLRKFGNETTTVASVVDQLGAKFGIPTKAISSFLGPLGEISAVSGGVVLAVGAAAVAFGKFAADTVDYADQLSNLSVATGISTSGLQRLESIGKTSGVTMDTLAHAVEQMNRRLDDPSAIAGIESLGLNYDKIRNLKPEQQFSAIAKALAEIDDPVRKANTGADIFGKTWDQIAPAISRNMQDVLKSAVIMSDGQIKALDHLGDEWDKFKDRQERSLRGWLGSLVVAANEAKLHWYDIFNPGIVARKLERGSAAGQIQDFEALPDLPNSPLSNPNLPLGLAAGLINKRAVVDASGALKDLADQIGRNKHEMTDAKAAAKEYKEGYESVREEVYKLNDALLKLEDRNIADQMSDELHDVAAQFAFIASKVAEIDATRPREIGTGLGYGPAKLPARTFTTGSGGILDNLAAGVPDAILAAIQGGGSKLQAAGSAIGLQLFGKDSGMTKIISGGISKLFGPDSFLTKTLGQAIPVIGSLIGPAIEGLGKLFQKVFGTAGRDAVRSFASEQGGFDELHKRLASLGADGEAMWKNLTQGVGRNNAAEAKAAIERVTAALEAQRKKLEELKASLTSTGSRLSHITTISPALQTALDKAMDAHSAKDLEAAITGINKAIDEQQAKFDHIKGALDKYGLSVSEAGKAFKQESLNIDAVTLRDDFDTLRGAGVDVNHVMEAMKANLQGFVDKAKAAGLEVPESMKEVIQVAIDAGTLFDKDGKKITDMSQLGLTFGTTMETVMKKTIPDALARLTTVLEGLAKFLGIVLPESAEAGAARTQAAIDGIDADVHGRVIIDAPQSAGGPDWEGAATGGLVTATGIQHFARGGRVLRFTPRGTDTVPAMLTPGEMVLTQKQQRKLLDGQGGSTYNVTIHAIDAQSFAQAMRKPGGGVDVVIEEILRDKRGRGTKLKRKLAG